MGSKPCLRLHHSSRQRQILNPRSEAGDRTYIPLDPRKDSFPPSHDGNSPYLLSDASWPGQNQLTLLLCVCTPFLLEPQLQWTVLQSTVYQATELIEFFRFHDLWKFPGQGLNPGHSCSNTSSFNPLGQARDQTCATTVTQATVVRVLTH